MGRTGRDDPVRRRAHVQHDAGKPTSASTWRATATTSRSARSTTGRAPRTRPAGWPSWAQGRTLDEIVTPYFEQVAAAARSGLFDTIGHLDVVKRYLNPHVRPADLAARPDLLEPALRALVESGTSLEMNTSGLRHPVRETYPTAETVERFRAMGGRGVTVGSDAHRADAFAFGLEEGYRILARAEFEELTFRRGGSRVAIALPRAVPRVTGDPAGLELVRRGRRTRLLRPARVRGRGVPRQPRVDHDPARPRPGRVHEPRGPHRAEHAHGRGDLAPASRPFRRPRAAAPLPALRVPPAAPRRGHRPGGPGVRLDALHDQPGFAAVSLDVTDHRAGAGHDRIAHPRGGPRRSTRTDSHAIRVAAGQGPGLVYSGDCGRADDLRPLIRPGDTLLAEATYGADPVAPGSNHLNALDVGRLAAETGVGRVLLTHVLMGRDRAKAVAAAAALVAVPVDVVDPGDRFEL